MRRIFSFLLIFALFIPLGLAYETEADNWAPLEDAPVAAEAGAEALTVPAPHVVLMERSTGTVLFEKAADERVSPASVTKVMTLLLTMEAIERGQLSLEQKVSVSGAAMSLGGSTAFLHEGESYTVDEMLKAVTIASANDASVVLAEAISGTEETFVTLMNRRAAELGMLGTNFVNCHGLDDPQHFTTAKDVAIMSRELLSHTKIRNYSTVWMDSLRDGTFTLSNTNRLVRYYEGTTGLKTGTTSQAGSCIAASAERDGMELIAVVMKADSTDDRYESARKMLDYGFAGYQVITVRPDEVLLPIRVILGREASVQPVLASEEALVLRKHQIPAVSKSLNIAEEINAPVEAGAKLGDITLELEGEVLISVDIIAAEGVERLSWWDVFRHMFGMLTMSEKPKSA